MPRDLFADMEKPKGRDLLADMATPKQEEPGTSPEPFKEQSKGFTSKLFDGARDIGIGLFKGVMESAGGVYQKLHQLGRKVNPLEPQGAVPQTYEKFKEAERSASEAYKGASNWAIPGRIAGNIAGTTPLMPAVSAIGKLPGLASSVSGRLAGAGLAGAGQGALVAGSQYDPTEQDINTRNMALGAAAGGVLSPAINLIPIVRTRLRNDELVGKAYDKIIEGVSKRIGKAKNLGDAEAIASRAVKGIASKIKNKEKQVWDEAFKGIKNKPVNKEAFSTLKSKASEFIDTFADDITPSAKKWITNKIVNNKGDLSFNQLKEMRSMFRGYKDMFWKKAAKGDMIRDAAKGGNKLYDDMTDVIKRTADDYGKMNDFVKANTLSKEANVFAEETGLRLADAAKNRAVAGKFIDSLFTPRSSEVTKGTAQNLTKGMNRAAAAMALKKLAAKAVDNEGRFNVRQFFKDFNSNPKYQAMLESMPNQFKAAGNLMKVIEDTSRLGSLYAPQATAGVIVKFGGEVLRHLTSPTSGSLRRQLVKYGLIKNNDKMREYLGSKIMNNLARQGAFVGEDGTLEFKKTEK